MSLGQVYDLDLKRNESVIKEVVLQAQGEVSQNVRRRLPLTGGPDGIGGVPQAGSGDVDFVLARSHQLPKQMPSNQVRLRT
jgi:hypothetical protein